MRESDQNHLRDLNRTFYSNLVRLESPDIATFLREAVASHQPALMTGLMPGELLSLETFERHAPKKMTVNLTPNGRADSVCADLGVFQLPLEKEIDTALFLDMLRNPQPSDPCPYLSEQNNNLVTRFESTESWSSTVMQMRSIVTPKELGLAAFGNVEASNLWIGDGRSTSSLHKDHYENVYCVHKGEKTFVLINPADVQFLQREATRSWEVRRWKEKSDDLVRPSIQNMELLPQALGEASIDWIDDWERLSPAKISPLTVTVKAGEVLYLPALWFHEVSQSKSEITIGVNFWCEMRFDHRWVLFQTLHLLGGGVVSTIETEIEE